MGLVLYTVSGTHWNIFPADKGALLYYTPRDDVR